MIEADYDIDYGHLNIIFYFIFSNLTDHLIIKTSS
jgi:hypothetical protein